VGVNTYAWRSTVTCTAGTEAGYSCTGWTGTGAVPASGTESTTGLITLVQPISSITWEWEVAADDDNDGISDQWERDNFGDLTTADAATDSDGDGISDLDEYLAGTDPNVANTEGAIAAVDFRDYTLEVISELGSPSPAVGVNTYAWRSTVTCSAGTEEGYVTSGWTGTGSVPPAGTGGHTGPILLDQLNSSIVWEWQIPNDDDGDGLSNVEEGIIGTNPAIPDTDGDGLLDGAEVNLHGTDPLLADTDGDLLNDGFEVGMAAVGADPNLDQTDLFTEWANEIRNDTAIQAEFGLYTESSIRNIYADALLISVDSETGQVTLDFEIKWTDDLENPAWQSLEILQATDQTSDGHRFYRVFVGNANPPE
jgi:hypothetical protein